MRRPKISPEELGRLIARFDCDPNLTGAKEHHRLMVRDHDEVSHTLSAIEAQYEMFLDKNYDIKNFSRRTIVIPKELVKQRESIAFDVYLEGG